MARRAARESQRGTPSAPALCIGYHTTQVRLMPELAQIRGGNPTSTRSRGGQAHFFGGRAGVGNSVNREVEGVRHIFSAAVLVLVIQSIAPKK